MFAGKIFLDSSLHLPMTKNLNQKLKSPEWNFEGRDYQLSSKNDINNFIEIICNLIAANQLTGTEGLALEKLLRSKLESISQSNDFFDNIIGEL